MDWKKFSKIENFSNIALSLSLQEAKYIIQEKIDGSNISFIFDGYSEPHLASRNNMLGVWHLTTFQGVDQAFKNNPRLHEFMKYFDDMARNLGKRIQVYGELFGPEILRRVWYGKDVDIRFFDIAFDDEYEPTYSFLALMSNFKDLIVPILAENVTIDEVKNFDLNFQSQIYFNQEQFRQNNPENIAEGIIVRPINDIKDKFGQRIIFKIKNENFSERKVSKSTKKIKCVPDDFVEVLKEFKNYINENRILSYYSKNGEIQEYNQIGEYIKGILEDVTEDFLKNYLYIGEFFDGEIKRYCYKNSSALIVEYLKETINKRKNYWLK